MYDDSMSTVGSPWPRPTSAGSANGHFRSDSPQLHASAAALPDDPGAVEAPDNLLQLLQQAGETGGTPLSFVDHPTAKSPVSPPEDVKGVRVRGLLKPRPTPKPRFIPNLKPLYYFDGATGYDCLQHRSSSALYGSRVFSVRSCDPSKTRERGADGRWNDSLTRGHNHYVNRETTTSTLGSSSTNADRQYLNNQGNVTLEAYQVCLPRILC